MLVSAMEMMSSWPVWTIDWCQDSKATRAFKKKNPTSKKEVCFVIPASREAEAGGL